MKRRPVRSDRTLAIRKALGEALDRAHAQSAKPRAPSKEQKQNDASKHFLGRGPALLGRVVEPTYGRPRKDESDLEYDMRIAARELKVVPADSLAYEKAKRRRRELYRRFVKLPKQISPKGAKARRTKAAVRRLVKARRVARDPLHQALLRAYRTFPNWYPADDIIRLTAERLHSEYSGDLDHREFEAVVREHLKPLLASRKARKAPRR